MIPTPLPKPDHREDMALRKDIDLIAQAILRMPVSLRTPYFFVEDTRSGRVVLLCRN